MQLARTARRPQPGGHAVANPPWRNLNHSVRPSKPIEPEPINPWTSLGDAAARILAQLEVRR
jgi:hypothetical protein